MAQVRSIFLQPKPPVFYHYSGPPKPEASKRRLQNSASRHVTFRLPSSQADSTKVVDVGDSTSSMFLLSRLLVSTLTYLL
jgi:hypothetical protein